MKKLKDKDFLKSRFDVSRITEEMEEKEKELENKWFDYRGKSAFALDVYFFAVYVRHYRRYLKKTDDAKKAVYAIPDCIQTITEDGVPFVDAVEVVKLRKARQSADSIGCEYNFFIKTALDRAHEYGWHHIPRFENLSSPDTVMDADSAWKKNLEENLELGAPEFMSVPALEQYHEYLLGQIEKRPESVRESMIERLTRDGHLPKI